LNTKNETLEMLQIFNMSLQVNLLIAQTNLDF